MELRLCDVIVGAYWLMSYKGWRDELGCMSGVKSFGGASDRVRASMGMEVKALGNSVCVACNKLNAI